MSSAPRILTERYELGAVLGRGGMADVFRARDRVLHREVAVKLLRVGSEVDRERFAGEAQMLAMLSHANIVTVLDAGVEGDSPWLVLELVEGTPMDERLIDGPAEATWLAAIGAQLASALAHAHAHGIVHRDVKPSNVLLAAGDRAKLSDFGIARRTASASLTLTGHTIGTAAYLAPEQVAGEAVSTPADVYALGLVLLEALTGRREYEGPAAEAAFARLQRSPGVPASLPRGWHGLISKMTARTPAERPTASEVEARLDVLADRSAPALSNLTDQWVSRDVPVTRRRKTILVGAGLAGLLLASTLLLVGDGNDVDAPSSERSSGVGSVTPRATAEATKPEAAVATPGESLSARTVQSERTRSPAPVKMQRDRQADQAAKDHGKQPKIKRPPGKKHKPPGGKGPGKKHQAPGGKGNGKPGGKP